MSHEPECPFAGSTEFDLVVGCDDCDRLRAAYQRGCEETFAADWSEIGQLAAVNIIRRRGYTQGYNEAMRLHKNLDVMDWVYGQNREERMTQHGKGENP